MSKKNPKVDDYLKKAKLWREEITALREIVLDCGLTEELKWRVPVYTYENNNVVIINSFKASCVLGFFKGALLKDKKTILEKPGENTQSARQVPITSVEQLKKLESVLKAYIREAIEIEKAGLKVEFKKEPEPMPKELKVKMNEDAKFKKAFDALTPGRQRGYIIYFSAAKQSKSRTSRIEKYRGRILDGKGIHDCVCGLSKP